MSDMIKPFQNYVTHFTAALSIMKTSSSLRTRRHAPNSAAKPRGKSTLTPTPSSRSQISACLTKWSLDMKSVKCLNVALSAGLTLNAAKSAAFIRLPIPGGDYYEPPPHYPYQASNPYAGGKLKTGLAVYGPGDRHCGTSSRSPARLGANRHHDFNRRPKQSETKSSRVRRSGNGHSRAGPEHSFFSGDNTARVGCGHCDSEFVGIAPRGERGRSTVCGAKISVGAGNLPGHDW